MNYIKRNVYCGYNNQTTRGKPMNLRRTISNYTAVIAIVLTTTLGIPASQAHAMTPPQVVSETWLNSRTVDIAVSSPSIDWPTRSVRLLLPQDWTRTTT